MQTKENLRISILGCGWYGFELGKMLVQKGHVLKGSTTSVNKLDLFKQANITPYLLNFTDAYIPEYADFFESDILIIALPPTKITTKENSYEKWIDTVAKLASGAKVKHVLFISSTSVYADNNSVIDESTSPDPITASGKSILAAEKVLQQEYAFTTTVIRFAGLVGPGREPGKFFAGKQQIPNGKAPVNLIHLLDCIGITIGIIEKHAFNVTYNACSPHHPEKQHFYTLATLKMGLTAPDFIDELINWKEISSNRVDEMLAYEWKTPNWDNWLKVKKN